MKIILFTCKRLIFLVPTILGIVVFVFIISHIIPADPAALVAGPFADQKQIEEIRHMYGLDRPLHEQLWMYLIQLISGDLGESVYTHRPVAYEIKTRFPATLELAIVSLFSSVILGVPIGIYTAIKRNKWIDHLTRGITIAGLAIAAFWLGIMLQLCLGYWLRLLPIAGRISGNAPASITGLYLLDSILTLDWGAFVSSVKHIILPAATLTFTAFATLVRFTRAGVLNALNSDYALYEQSMGLPRRLFMYKYVLRNSLTATVSQIGLLFGLLLAGSVVIERVFSWPGLGSFAVESIIMMDYKAVLAVAIWSGFAYTLGNLFVDIILAFVDPRETTR
jgi:peptide/nickel transport system permease protein